MIPEALLLSLSLLRKKHEVRGERKEYEGTGRTIVLTVGILLNHDNQTDYICEREWGRTLLALLNFTLM